MNITLTTHYSKLFNFILVLLLPLLCNLNMSAQTIFSGGSLDDLKALSPTLTFNQLVIDGELKLDEFDNTTINATDVTITDKGSVSFSQGLCDYFDAPNFFINATGNVIIDGNIRLDGKSGRSQLSSSTCNRCGGKAGGKVKIDAGSITISSIISVDGGSGSSFKIAGISGSTGCVGGAGGSIELNANNIDLSDVQLENESGNGGFGSRSTGSDGATGTIVINTTGKVTMKGGSVVTNGAINLTAGSSEIFAPFTYNTFTESIDGKTDSMLPVVAIIFPVATTQVRYSQPLQIQIDVNDNNGTGVKEIKITGLGTDQTFSSNEIINGRLTATISDPVSPNSITVIVTDNKGNSTTKKLENLVLAGSFNVNQGETLTISEDLNIGSNYAIQVDGTIIIKRGSNPQINSGTFTLGTTGKILAETATSATITSKAPSLTINVANGIDIKGEISLSGSSGFSPFGSNNGESGGNLTIFAGSANISGVINLNGGNGTSFTCPNPFGFGTVQCGGDSGDAGFLSVYSRGSLTISGTINANGGDAKITNISSCFVGGIGGRIQLDYSTTTEVSSATFNTNYGEPVYFESSCGGNTDTSEPGLVNLTFRGTGDTPTDPSITIAEIEPNDQVGSSQTISYQPSTFINGNIKTTDNKVGPINFTNSTQDMYDIFAVNFEEDLLFSATLTYTSSSIRMGLIIFDSQVNIKGGNASDEFGDKVRLLFLNIGDAIELPKDIYYVGVTRDRNSLGTSIDYSLNITTSGLVDENPPTPDVVPNIGNVWNLFVTANPLTGGSTTGVGSFNNGTQALITASPATGFKFSKWIGAGINDINSSSTTVLMDMDRTVTAEFIVDVPGNLNDFVTWIQNRFPNITNTETIGFNKDPDRDGIPNLLEFALGLEPFKVDRNKILNVLKTGDVNKLKLVYQRHPNRSGIQYRFETLEIGSGDWIPYSPANSNKVTSLGVDMEEVEVEIDSSSTDQMIIRMQILQN